MVLLFLLFVSGQEQSEPTHPETPLQEEPIPVSLDEPLPEVLLDLPSMKYPNIDLNNYYDGNMTLSKEGEQEHKIGIYTPMWQYFSIDVSQQLGS